MSRISFVSLVCALLATPNFAEAARTPNEYTLLLARYDGEGGLNADFASGSRKAGTQGTPEIADTPHGPGVRISGDAAVTYAPAGNVDFRRGTVEMTLIPEWSSDNAPDQAYLFAIDYPHPSDLDYESYFSCRIIKGRKVEFQMYDYLLSSDELNWKEGEIHRIAFAWDNEAGLGLEVDEKGYFLTGTWKPFNLGCASIAVGCAGEGGAEHWVMRETEREGIFRNPFTGIIAELKISRVPLIPVGTALAGENFIPGEPGAAGYASSCRLLEFYNPEIVDSPAKIDYYQYRISGPWKGKTDYREDLRILRERNQLDKVIAPGRSEYEKQVLLCQWLTEQFPHMGKAAKGRTSHEILDAAREGRGGGLCGPFSSILVDCFRSLGWNARYASVSQHATFEAWSNQFNKWINMEPDYSAFPSKDGVPLNLMELHNLYVESIENPAAATAFDSVPGPFTQGHTSMADREDKGLSFYSTLRFQTSLGPGWFVYWDDYTRLKELPPGTGENHKKIKAYNLKRNEEEVEAGRIIENPDYFYWTLNKVNLRLAFSENPDSLKVTLTRSLTPLFKDYLAVIDGGTEKRIWEEFRWRLHPGVNTLEVKTRNEYGVYGHPSRIKVWVPYD